MILDGKACANALKEEILKEALALKQKPCLVAIQVGDDEASNVYLAQKEKKAKELGIDFWLIKYDSKALEEDILKQIKELNANQKVSAIMIQLPLPKGLNEDVLINAIDPAKDVDGLTNINQGKTLLGLDDAICSCTPLGIMRMLAYYKVPLSGKKVTIIGRSKLVGKPLIGLLLKENASVSILHSKTKDLSVYTKNSDIIIVAVGKKEFLTKNMISKNQVIIDVGINKEDGKLYGDVDFSNVANEVAMISPVPGGVGPMTVISLMSNVLKCARLQEETD